jgi:hypothetical protein
VTGSIFSIKVLKPKYLLALFLLIFAVSVLYLQSLKAPWVDECYSYYGVWHDNFSEFYNSMLTGINFSPPLYFLFNFCLQLIFPTSIEQLRIQSLAFIIIGIILSFLLTRKIFGTTIAFFSTILVASQSNLLLSLAQEARHYAMFFACGAWVLFMQSFNEVALRKYWGITFLSHFCLCQVHYLGIIFSGLVGLTYLISNKKRPTVQRIPFPVFTTWIISIPVYLLLLSQQSSHLGNWPKPNGLSNLIFSYNDSLLILTISIPCIALLLTKNSNKDTEPNSSEDTCFLSQVIITSVLWVSVPLIFWIISNLSSLNLFVDRYFIPKESALILVVGFGLSFIFQIFTQQKFKSIFVLGTFGLSLVLILVSTKRGAFGLDKNTNYHHSLIIDESYPRSDQPIILEGDPVYFPNAYLNRNEYFLLIKDEDLIKTYNQFSRKIKLSGI